MKQVDFLNITVRLKVACLAMGLVMTAEVWATPHIGQTGLAQRQAPAQYHQSSNQFAHPSNQYLRYGYTTYKGYADAYGTPLPQQYYPIRPHGNQRPSRPPHGYPHGYANNGYPNHGYPQNRPDPVYPQQNGVTIIYNHPFPTQTEYRTESHGFVNGNGTIESSSYTLISDWQRYNLPAPNVGMHWIFQNGRYLQVPNHR